jgi:cyclopropane-fatty-acyl-phospholipid synthase
MEILRLHYAETLRNWHERFQRNRDTARALYDERFCRMWEFYLQLCEIGYRRLNWMVFQIQLAKSVSAVPLTRTYLSRWQATDA